MRLVGMLLFFLALLAPPVYGATLNKLRFSKRTNEARLVFAFDRAFDFHFFRLQKSPRIVIDFKNSKITRKARQQLATLQLSSPLLAVRTARSRKGLRVVLDLLSKVPARLYRLAPKGAFGYRLLVVLRGVNKPASVPITPKRSRNIIVAIDPGHGGKDPGARGVGGLLEKNVVFQIAKDVFALFDKTQGFTPVLTRMGDYYVTLRGRTRVARKHHADLFVSLHADAYPHRRATGSSVFALSRRGASSETARWLAQKENAADLIGGVGNVSLDDKDEMLAGVLLDLSMTATLSASLKVGHKVLTAIKHFNRLHKKHVEQAAFVVLKSPDIPSILVETGFITNAHEVRKLKKRSYQRKMAAGIFAGIKTYFEARPPPGTLLATWKKKGRRKYTVRAGDTLLAVAAKYHTTATKIAQLNKLVNSKIYVGQALVLP